MAWFNLKDSIVTIQRALQVPTKGGMSAVPTGPMIRLLSVTKISMDGGGKASYIKGSLMTPLAIAIGTAEGKFELDCSNGFETATVRAAIGGIGSTCIVAINYVRQGMIPVGYLLLPATWENGGVPSEVDDTKGGSDKITIKFGDCLENGSSIYNKLA